MIEEKGTVIELKENTAKVLIPGSETCEGCRSCHESSGGFGMTCEVPRTGGLRMGDCAWATAHGRQGQAGGQRGERDERRASPLFFALPFPIVYRVYKKRRSSRAFPLKIVEIVGRGDSEA